MTVLVEEEDYPSSQFAIGIMVAWLIPRVYMDWKRAVLLWSKAATSQHRTTTTTTTTTTTGNSKKDEGIQSLHRGALLIVFGMTILLLLSSMLVSVYTEGLHPNMILVLGGLSRMIGSWVMFLVSLELPQWLGVYDYVQLIKTAAKRQPRKLRQQQQQQEQQQEAVIEHNNNNNSNGTATPATLLSPATTFNLSEELNNNNNINQNSNNVPDNNNNQNSHRSDITPPTTTTTSSTSDASPTPPVVSLLSLKTLRFDMQWRIAGQFSRIYWVVLLFSCGGPPSSRTLRLLYGLPVNYAVGVVLGFGLVGVIYFGRTRFSLRYNHHRAQFAYCIMIGLVLSSCVSFSYGCLFIQDVWRPSAKRLGNALLAFGAFTVSFVMTTSIHIMARTVSQRQLQEKELKRQKGERVPEEYYHAELFGVYKSASVRYYGGGGGGDHGNDNDHNSGGTASTSTASGNRSRARTASLSDYGGGGGVGEDSQRYLSERSNNPNTSANYNYDDIEEEEWESSVREPQPQLQQQDDEKEGDAEDCCLESCDEKQTNNMDKGEDDDDDDDDEEEDVSLSSHHPHQEFSNSHSNSNRVEEQDDYYCCEEQEPSFCTLCLAKTKCCKCCCAPCGSTERGSFSELNRFGKVVILSKWFIRFCVQSLCVYLTIVNVVATQQGNYAKQLFPTVHEELYGEMQLLDGPVCAYSVPFSDADTRTFPNATAALAANFTIAHCGECAQCSTWQNLELQWTTRRNLAILSRRCAKTLLFRGYEKSLECHMETIGFDVPCSDCWIQVEECAIQHCAGIQMQSWIIGMLGNFDVGPDVVTAAMCEEAICEVDLFVPCSGANRRRMNIVSDIARPSTQQCPLVPESNEKWLDLFGPSDRFIGK